MDKNLLIFDRTEQDLEEARYYVDYINKYGFENLTAEQKTKWYKGLKAFINYTDFNRIESVCAEISIIFGLGLNTKTNWTMSDVPNTTNVTRILSNVSAIRAKVNEDVQIPEVPNMPVNTIYKMNDIERILYIAGDYSEGYTYCGDGFYCSDTIGVL